jgi:hypothetical protein
MPPGPDLEAAEAVADRDHRRTHRAAPPDRAAVLEHDQRRLLFLTRCGSHRELVAHCQFNPTVPVVR